MMLVALEEGSCALVCGVLVGAQRVPLLVLCDHPRGRLGCWVLDQLTGVSNSSSSEYFVIQAAQGGGCRLGETLATPESQSPKSAKSHLPRLICSLLISGISLCIFS